MNFFINPVVKSLVIENNEVPLMNKIGSVFVCLLLLVSVNAGLYAQEQTDNSSGQEIRQYFDANPELTREQRREYVQQNYPEVHQKRMEHRAQFRQDKQAIREYFEANPDLTKEQKREYIQQKYPKMYKKRKHRMQKGGKKFHQERQAIREYFDANPELTREQKREYVQQNYPEAFKRFENRKMKKNCHRPPRNNPNEM